MVRVLSFPQTIFKGLKTMGVQILLIVAVLVLIPATGQILNAQDQPTPIEEFKKKAQDIGQEIEKGKAKIQKYTRKEADIIYRLNKADRALNQSRKKISSLGREIARLDKIIAETTLAAMDLKEQIKTNEQYVANRLVALYKLNWLGKFQVLASAESLHELLQRKTALERMLAHDEMVMQELMENRASLETIRSQQESHRNVKRRHAGEYQKQIDRMANERAKRSALLARVRKEKSVQQAAIESLKNAARRLDQTINNLGSGLESAAVNKNLGREPFGTYKGLLKMPVKGKIISLFGKFKNSQYNVLNFRSGIEIQTDRGEPIQAVHDGKIIYADWFKGYGNMIIIDHGDSYYTVYAHVEEAFKTKGDTVEAGEVIATVGDTGSITGPKLYFEVRHHGNPVDPLEWLATS
jgi:septal ring factor EnvC (AmiA/AmiB activator)